MSVVNYEVKDKIAYITINRPEAMNATDYETDVQLVEAMDDMDRNPDVMVGILTGAGNKAFCAGADLKKRDKPVGWDANETIYVRLLAERSKPMIAAINGYCLAGGFELALLCDVRIASENAQFGTPEVKWGLLDGFGCLQAGRELPRAIMMELLLTGEFISAQEALRHGFISRVVSQAELMPTAEKIARRIADNGPIAVRMTKYFAHRGQNLSMDEGLKLYWQLAHIIHTTDDAVEGPRAFAEKRIPRFNNT